MCLAVKVNYPKAQHVVGLATESGNESGQNRSEDVMYMDLSNWTEEMQKNAVETQAEFEILVNVTERRQTYSEFPESPHLDIRKMSNYDKKIRRNKPCICGSGKKFKNCCMKGL